jgi:asparagine synthase (glutamine-hydrolysing)
LTNININIKETNFWKKYNNTDITIYLKGYIYSHTIEKIIETVKLLEMEDIESFINSLDGHFALIVETNEFSFIAVDKIRSTPLFFANVDDIFYIDYDPKKLAAQDKFKKYIRDDSVLEISMSGYTIGNKTIYKDLYSLKAGELVVFENNSFKYKQYYKYFGNIEQKDYDTYLEELSEVTLNIFRKMLNQIGDRQIIIPLSAGNDSRLVASVLKHLGATNVKCYSYGSVGNFEASIAKMVAKKLGYEWVFVPLTHKTEKQYYSSSEYQNYLKFAETCCSIPYIQGLSAIKYLKDMDFIDKDAIFVNGNSGDFISGSHINGLIGDIKVDDTQDQRKKNILDNLIKKHFSLWGYLKTDVNIDSIKKSLWSEMSKACGDLNAKEKDHLFYEYSEFINRQSKYVITGQKSYEYYEHEWRMPLWDDEYLYFWQVVPVEFKLNQHLYVDMLKKKNYGGVWGGEIPVNKKTINPRWMVPLRFLLKIPFAFFGRKGKIMWKRFEMVFLYYWMDVTHMMDFINYGDIIKSFKREPRNFTSWLAVSYVASLDKKKKKKIC